ncbi:Spc98 family-domain-containing protein [Clohesyomyces aquaticus]|uniref:Spindle pole body component n=1 Tax=Clohesyomyces aquaticus TaxID=1231657 RepID=A0A1Y1YZB8_9PLEO|nr:Spc98 family-domain-containing protein [Clohesyomyces aquaticus]
MAQNAKLGALTEELIRSIVKFDPATNKQAYRHAKDLAKQGLRAHQYGRTNQFDVQASYKGLDEKFRVLNRDDLADALDKRLEELQAIPNKWTPEYLSLLLQLSDRPVENSQVEALELLRPPPPTPPLTWAEIVADDPYSDEDIWKDIDYAAESSEDDRTPKKRGGRQSKEDSLPSSIDHNDAYDPESCIVPVHAQAIQEISESQFWKAAPEEQLDKIEITELQAIREALFMLAGLPTSLYVNNPKNGSIRVNHKYNFSHALTATMEDLLSQLADIGQDLYRLRQWTLRRSPLPLIQTFEAAIQFRLTEYDHEYLASQQRRYLVPDTPIAVSLLELHHDIRSTSRPLVQLAKLVAEIEPLLLVNPFAHLETLFDRTGAAQMALESDVFEFLSKIFFECLQTYLKPIRKWMESGELGANDETFFVFESDSGSEVSSLWHDRYVLRRGKGNALRSPEFLQPAAHKIFNTGKSVIFLKELGIYGTGLASTEPEPRLDHLTVCGDSSTVPLSPFAELFEAAFERWIRSKFSLASTVLREHLFVQFGLFRILKVFSHLFLGEDGSVFQDFADAIFERMDSRQRGWNDRYLLTELARGVFTNSFAPSDVDKVIVRTISIKDQGRSVKNLRSIAMDYALPWPIMNIIQRSSISIYQQVFTFLLQTYRAKYLLQRVEWNQLVRLKDNRLTHMAYKLRQRLMWFSDILRSYLSETVIAISTQAMTADMGRAEDIDEMSNIHIKFLARLQEQALLSQNLKPIYRAIISLLDLGVLFSEIHEKIVQKLPTAKLRHDLPPKSPAKPAKAANRRKSVIPLVVENQSSDSSDSELDADGDNPVGEGSSGDAGLKTLNQIEEQFGKLLPFVTAGLRSVSRAGAKPVWEMLAERLEWDKPEDKL